MNEYIVRFLYMLWYLANLTFAIRLALAAYKHDMRWLTSMFISMSVLWVIFMARYFI